MPLGGIPEGLTFMLLIKSPHVRDASASAQAALQASPRAPLPESHEPAGWSAAEAPGRPSVGPEKPPSTARIMAPKNSVREFWPRKTGPRPREFCARKMHEIFKPHLGPPLTQKSNGQISAGLRAGFRAVCRSAFRSKFRFVFRAEFRAALRAGFRAC